MKTALIAALALTGCSEVIGSGTAITEPRSVGEFRAVAVQSGLKLQLAVGPRAVSITTDDNLIRFIEAKVENAILVIRMQQNVPLAPRSFEALVSAPELVAVDVSGGGTIEGDVVTPDLFAIISTGHSRVALSGVETMRLRVDASGGSTVLASGSARDLALTASGAARLDFSALQAQLLEVELSGASFATARVSNTVRGTLSGASQLQILGNPASREVEVSGGSVVEVTQP